jgi:hypothetical protein
MSSRSAWAIERVLGQCGLYSKTLSKKKKRKEKKEEEELKERKGKKK